MTGVRRLAVLLMSLGVLTFSAHSRAMDLSQTWQLALTNDPTYQAARANYRAAVQKMPQARANLLPEIEGSLTGAYLDNRATGTLGQVFEGSRSAWTLNLTQPIFNWSAIQTYEQSKLQVASAEIQLQLAYQDLMLRVSESYFRILALQDELDALKAEQRSIAEQLAAAKRRFELGDATVTDALEAQARFDLTSANIIGLENELSNAEDELARIIGRQPMPQTLYPLPYNVDLPAPQPNKLTAWSDQARAANLNVVRAEIQTRIAKYDIEIAKSGHYPSVSLTASSTSNTVGNSQVRPFYDGRTIDNTVGLTLSVPIYSGGGVSATVVEKAELQQKSVYDLEAERRRSLQQSRQFFNGVQAGLARIKGLEAAEKSSLSALRANLTGYEIGVRINLDVLDAQRQLFITKRDLAAARYNTLLTSLRLRANSGVLSESDLFAINQLLRPPGSPGTGIMHDVKKLR
ncbi:MAG: TolC family outer membrane protein [Burkholderiaceae bacterium]|nr:TolC family outer membrane protein [Burkholderiaceae bacterium]MCD8517446.1 TolC family outer membrane protein [Burkholderiaceae bacterium]MCD8537203.1 TolC family outer membrane protein [Burkholderiaceae bacterium]